MRRNKKQKKSFVMTLCLLLTMVIGIGYAVLSQQLSINGGLEYGSMKWDVGFKTATDGGGTVNSNPAIADDKKSITITCDIGTSTASETCIANAVIANNSTFDVQLDANPTITYDDAYIQSVAAVWSNNSKSVVKSDTIKSQSEREMIVTITTRELTSNMLPETNTSIPVEITMNWSEKSNNSGEDLPSYWKTYLDSKIVEINKKTNDMETGSDSFIFITDQHLDGSLDYSSSIINYITGNTSVKKVVFGGDILQGSQDDETILSEYRTSFDDSLLVMPIRGNHDADGNLNDNTYYNIMIKPLEDKIENNNKLYYYYDNDNSKIRYIFTDSTSGGETNLISDKQITWMKEKILELESDWTVLVFVHGIWTGSETNSELIMSNQGNKIVNAIDEVYDQANCAIAGVYTGHTHRDYYKQSEKGYFLASTTLDASSSGLTKYDPVNPVRNSGTTEEQSFDIVFINTKNKNVETIRIGVGNNRIFNYEKNNYTIEKTDITDQFTWTSGTINIKNNGAYTNEYSDLWLYSNAVDVSAYKSITFTHIQTTSSATTAGYAFYDKDGNFIIGGSNFGSSYAPVEKTINVPSTAKYFRTMWMNTGHSSYNEEIHNIDAKFKCYGNEVVISNNADLTSQFEWTAGSIQYSTGVASNEYSDLWLYSNAVDVSAYKSITFTHIQTTSSATTAGYAFYDKDGNFIIGGSNYGESYAPVEKTIFVPADAKYFRTMWMNTGNSNYNNELHNIDSKFRCEGNKDVVNNSVNITNQFEWTAGSIQHSTGVASEEFSDSWLYSNEVDVSAYKSITFTHIQTTNPVTPLGYAFYDENHTYISGATNGGKSYNPTIKTIKVPSNAKYFRTMWINTTNASYNSVSHNISTIFKCYGNK